MRELYQGRFWLFEHAGVDVGVLELHTEQHGRSYKPFVNGDHVEPPETIRISEETVLADGDARQAAERAARALAIDFAAKRQ